ncbi:hypothetical protein GP486_003523 [Trichoglossum hirsutum]|uniref:Uncharacterized protein n=1 Tax=Trichoglossum hirsutum TaxID=265104 RepID=A0A9P8LD21_9PEZI|nr:hypothetical protein GP486_003523 [Trichoglossum hirsutum]
MALVIPYSSEIFNALPSLKEASTAFEKCNGDAAVLSLLELIEQHGVSNKFGVVLLHRHFGLQKNEALVDVNGTSTPWKIDESSDTTCFDKYGGQILPHSWAVRDGQLTPYEFTFYNAQNKRGNRPGLAVYAEDNQFVEEFIRLVESQGLSGVFALTRASKSPNKLLEVTEGGANVTFEISDDKESSTGGRLIPAAWGYHSRSTSGKQAGPHITRGCFQWCTGPYDMHVMHHVSDVSF